MKNKTIILLIVYVVLGVFLFIAGQMDIISNNAMRYLMQMFLYITLGEMWNLLSGFAGMTSLGQQTFIGLAGYTVAMTTTVYKMNYGTGILVGTAVCIVTSSLLAFMLLKMEGMYFSITTWVIAEALGTFFLSWGYVGKGAGMNVSISPYPRIDAIYGMSLILCFITLLVVYLMLNSRLGLGLIAMRDNITAAASMGVNIRRSKFVVYLIAAIFTGLAGSIMFINKGTIYPESGFSIGWTISMVFIVIIGGSGTIEGPIVGSVIYVFLQEFLAHYPGWSNIILGIIAIIIILYMPEGIVGSVKKMLDNKGNKNINSLRKTKTVKS